MKFGKQLLTLTNFFAPDYIQRMRQVYAGNPVELGVMLSQDMIWSRPHGYVSFKNGAGGMVAVPNDFGGPMAYPLHTVCLLEESVFDVLHTDSVMSIKQYIKRVKKLTPKLEIDFDRSSPSVQRMILQKLI